MTDPSPTTVNRTLPADSDEVARAFRDDVARYSDMMSPGAGASLASVFWHQVAGTVNVDLVAWEQAASERARP
jgi:hypothetical protein